MSVFKQFAKSKGEVKRQMTHAIAFVLTRKPNICSMGRAWKLVSKLNNCRTSQHLLLVRLHDPKNKDQDSIMGLFRRQNSSEELYQRFQL